MIQCFKELDLCEQIQKNLAKKGYETPSPIQSQAIPHLLEGKDLLGCAQTGTGKTAAFALPLLNELGKAPRKLEPYTARVLVLTPTRELAAQVAESFKLYGEGLGLKTMQVFGGVGFGPQKSELKKGTDILVACPGRLLDLKSQGFYKPHGVRYLVLDEADRMLDMGFSRDVQKIVSDLSTDRQTILFSATMPDSVMKFASRLLKSPVEVRVNPESSTVEKIEQRLCFVRKKEKRNLLKVLLRGQMKQNDSLCLVFSRTKHGANRLVTELDRVGVNANAIHGNKSQGARQRALDDFKSARVRVLVATDVAARGIDVKGVTMVVNFDIPIEPEAYVHRIGRTARAGAGGQAISFCCEEEYKELYQIQKLIKQEIPVDRDQPHHDEAVEMEFKSGAASKKPKGKKRSPSYQGNNRRRKPSQSRRMSGNHR